MKIYENYSLKGLCTFGLEAKAKRLLVLEKPEDAAMLANEAREKYLILGGGSNMVFTRDFDGTVVTLERLDRAERLSDNLTVRVWGGMILECLLDWAEKNNLHGGENLTAIPGTIGGAVVQNAGAYGAETSTLVQIVEAWDMQQQQMVTFSSEECHFGYRTSMFKQTAGRYLILTVTMRFSDTYEPNLDYKALKDELTQRGCKEPTASEVRKAVTDVRWSKLPKPEEYGSAGSFFKNPVVDEATYQRLKAEHPDMPEAHSTINTQSSRVEYKLSAGWLIDRAGWKGRTIGGAGVWPKQALVLYNNGGCTGHEIVALSNAIIADVQSKYGIILTPEAIII